MDPVDLARLDPTLEVIVSLVEAAAPARGDVLVVAVDGPSGSGKSTLAVALSRRLGAPVVPLDDIYPGWDGLGQAPGLVTDQVLAPLARGEEAAYRRWDWGQGCWAGSVPVPRTRVLILEGCGSSVRPAGDFAAVRVWVEADPVLRFERGIARDGEAYRPHWQRWAAQEDALFAADGTRARADLIIDTTHGVTLHQRPH